MKQKLQNLFLKKISMIALAFAIGSISQASTIFTYQPELTDEMKACLKKMP